MSNVVRLQDVARPYRSPYAQFCEARGVMIAKLALWLRTGPCAEDAAAEIDGTISAMSQIAALAEARHE